MTDWSASRCSPARPLDWPTQPTRPKRAARLSSTSASPTGAASRGSSDVTSSTTDLIVIDDADDPRLACFRRNERGLTNRRQRRNDEGDGLFMAEGDLVVERALDAGCTAVIALVDAAKPPPVTGRLPADVPIYAGGDRVRAMVTQLGTPQGIVALFARPARVSVEALAQHATRLIVAEAVDNPINIGSIVRNAVALGWNGMIFDYTS